ncbi:MAG: SDR family oxidoreductase [Desulfobacteraceae bacterium]|nr:MAG: SDR family oxidoreductase [Desulfobacteraceae bacterium]
MIEAKRTLEGKVALITGGGTGIGKGIAERFVEEGAKICVTGRRVAILESLITRFPAGSACFCVGDVTSLGDVNRMIQAALDMGGRLDVLVNNAGITGPTPVAEVDPEVWRRTIETNLIGPFLTMHMAIPIMISQGGGSIINVASVGGIRTIPMASAYCASKAGLIHLSRQVSSDYGSKGIRCNAVCPGFVRTEMVEHEMDILAGMMGTDREGAEEAIARNIPVGRISAPKDIAGIFVYLASDDSRFMTGATLVIDGGGAPVDAGTIIFRRAGEANGKKRTSNIER